MKQRRPPTKGPAKGPDADDVHREILEHLEQNPPPARPKKPAPSRPSRARTRSAGGSLPPPRSSRPRVMLRMMRLVPALEKLDHFVRYHCSTGTAEIVVVVGKGHRSGANGPVIGPAVRNWCDEHRGLVADYREAPPSEGGEGALILRLVPRA